MRQNGLHFTLNLNVAFIMWKQQIEWAKHCFKHLNKYSDQLHFFPKRLAFCKNIVNICKSTTAPQKSAQGLMIILGSYEWNQHTNTWALSLRDVCCQSACQLQQFSCFYYCMMLICCWSFMGYFSMHFNILICHLVSRKILANARPTHCNCTVQLNNMCSLRIRH